VKLSNRLTPNQKKFVAEVIGTFIVVVSATGSVVIDSRLHGLLGISFIAFAPFVGIAIAVYLYACSHSAESHGRTPWRNIEWIIEQTSFYFL